MAAVVSLSSLPIGIRFRPTDEEVIDFYLRSKINGDRNDELGVIREVDVCKCEPWDLPNLSTIRSRDPEWFFFCPLDRKYPNGNRLNRATKAGYWKATGKDRKIKSGSSLIGMKKTLVFYTGRAPRGNRTNWVMHEYRTTLDELDGTKPGQNPFVICRLFKKQDETIEDINGDDVVSSHTEDLQSELEVPQDSPMVGGEAEKHFNSTETCPTGLHNEVISNAVPPMFEWNNDGYKALDVAVQAVEIAPAGVDQIGGALTHFYDPMMQPLDWELFSPLHLQIEAEQAPGMFDHFGNNLSVVEREHGTNESDFLNSILKDLDDYYSDDSGNQKNSIIENETPKTMVFGKDGGSCFESDAEVAGVLIGTETANRGAPLEIKSTAQDCTIQICKQEVNVSGTGAFYNVLNSKGESSSYVNTPSNVDSTVTGIRIRHRTARNRPDTVNSVTQGDAPGRCKLQVSSLYCGNAINNWSREEKEDDYKPVVTKEEDITVDGDAALEEVVPSRWLKKFAACRRFKPFAVHMFRVVAVMLVLIIVLVSTLNVL